MAVIIKMATKGPLASSLRFLTYLISGARKGQPITEEDASEAAGLQECLFVCASHRSDLGSCKCAHHRVAYSFGEISDAPYHDDISEMLPFLVKTRTILKGLIARSAKKAITKPKKAGIAKAQKLNI
jgi:hypothetical protein